MTSRALVIGMGDVGRAIADVLSTGHEVQGRDVEPLDREGPVDVLHVCYPYEEGGFVDSTVRYGHQYEPRMVMIHSTVVPGTTRRVQEAVSLPVAYSPVRGKHDRLPADLRRYTKFVASFDGATTDAATKHLQDAGLRTQPFPVVEGLELAKLLETTYFGLLVAWAQEVARYSGLVGADYEDVMRFLREIDYLPPEPFRPGFIGGRCVIQNTDLLEQIKPSDFIDAIRASNRMRFEEGP